MKKFILYIYIYIYIYVYCGREWSKHNIEPMGSVRGWGKAHLCTNLGSTHGLRSEEGRHRDHTNPSPTHELRSKEGRRRDLSSEELEERVHLENASTSHLHQRTGHHGRHQRCASKEDRKYLGKVAINFTFNALHQLSWPH